MSAESPARIGRYEILSELGHGSMGRVYLARDPNIDRQVALKVLAPARGVSAEDEAELRQRFVLEARAAGRVNHPGIVTVYDAETDAASGQAFIAMEWIDGESLETALARGPLPAEEVARLGAEVALALDAAHEAGLVHRDVKPANILLDSDGHAKVSDFGIAKFAALSNTSAGRLLGSPFYMAPEQVRNEEVDRRSDLFSLGSVLYQAATGQVPFGSDSLAGISYKILEIDPPPADSVAPAVGAELAAVLTKTLAKDPRERFQSGKALARALGRAAPRPGATTPTGTLILDPEDLLEGAPQGWLARHRGAVLAGLTLVAAPLLVLLLSTRSAVETPLQPPVEPPTAEDTLSVDPPRLELSAPVPPPASTTLASTPSPVVTAAPAPRPATVDLRYRNHLRSGRMTVKVDDVEVWSGEVGSDKGFLGRTVGNDVWPRITVPAGKHVIGVHIEGSDGSVDATKRIWAVFEPGSRQRLKVRLVPPRVLRLSWED